jgi:arylsulfatase
MVNGRKRSARLGVIALAGVGVLSACIAARSLWTAGNDPTTPGTSAMTVLNRLDLATLDTRKPEGSRHILLITLDTLRADHLSCYGYPKQTSPFLDSFAGQGVRFTRAFAPMPTTVPSHATLLTALYPLQHRVVKNGHLLTHEVGTLPEILAADGFETAGIVSTNMHFIAGNLHQGFEYFDEPTAMETLYVAEGSDCPVDLTYRPADRTVQRALDWLAQRSPSSRVFLWIHLFDPHHPYAERREHADALLFDDPEQEQRWLEFMRREHLVDLSPDAATITDNVGHCGAGRKDDCVELYDAEIHFLDASLRAFFEGVNRLALDDFMTVIVADHGEGLGSHGWWGHGKHIYNEQIRVPLILRWTDGRFAGTTVDTVVEMNDIMPTILRAAGTDKDLVSSHRRLPIEGTPLQALLGGEGGENKFGYAFVQRRAYDPAARYRDNFEDGESFALLDSDWKYIHRTAGRDDLYNLISDFHEQDNVIASDVAEKSHLRSMLDALVHELSSTTPFAEESIPEETVRALRSLGYVQ